MVIKIQLKQAKLHSNLSLKQWKQLNLTHLFSLEIMAMNFIQIMVRLETNSLILSLK